VESIQEQQFSSDDLAVFKAYATVFSLAANRNQLRQSLFELKRIDRLTGLPLLSTFHRQLADLIRGVRSRALSVAVLAVDIYDFSGFNRELGYTAGDRILGEAAGRMQSVLGDKAILARYGPDSFLICLSGVDMVSAEAYAARIHEDFALNPIEVSRGKISLQVCIGGAVSHVDRMILKLPGIAVRAVEMNSSRPGSTAVTEVGQFYDKEH
jgi:diguanylate cyclase (GGDEF)-like protein